MQVRKKFVQRAIDFTIFTQAIELGFTELQARVIAGRITSPTSELNNVVSPSLLNLSHPELLQDCKKASDRIVDAIIAGKPIGIVTDYDVDGISSHALLVEALGLFNFPKECILGYIGHRLKDGYGLSINVAKQLISSETSPDIVITADCGSSDHERIKLLSEAGIDVIVTDHHAIPKEGVPAQAYAVVNPNREDCQYPDKSICGCMVSWLVMCQVRNTLINRGWLPENTPKLGNLLDYVALSTVADAVSLSNPSNRAVVVQGLLEINSLKKPAWRALAQMCGSNHNGSHRFTVEDLGFQVGPRVNAQGRVDDALIAVQFFLSQNDNEAIHLLKILDLNNQKRRDIEKEMVDKAHAIAGNIIRNNGKSLVISDSTFHPGVQGIVASRLLDAYGVPAVILSPMPNSSLLAGSARTIPSIHIRNVFQEIDNSYPDIIKEFGGHRGAAGVKIEAKNLDNFSKAVESIVRKKIVYDDLKPQIVTDGELSESEINKAVIDELNAIEPFGNKFESPVFEGLFQVKEIRVLGKEPIHLGLTVAMRTSRYKAIWFRALEKAGSKIKFNNEDTIRCAYKLKLNMFRGKCNLQLLIEHAQPAE